MNRAAIPAYPLTDYVPPAIAEQGISVSRFEILNKVFNRPAGVHRHEHFELFWVKGPAEHFNDFRRFTIRAGQPTFVFVSPGQLHRWEGTDAIRGTLISFTAAFLDGREPPPGALQDYGFVHTREFPPVLPADASFLAEAKSLIARCEQEFSQKGEGWQEAIRSLIRVLLVCAQRAYRRSDLPQPPSARPRHLLREFQAMVEESFRTKSAVADYAQPLGVSAGHLSDLVRELTGGTAGELIRSRILLEARRLLFHSELSVAEIAYHLGFEDPSYFGKVFRKAVGQSPADFRKNYQTHRE